jgi:hypothetical protein
MAIVHSNDLIEGFSGMFGDTMVFRNLRGKTVVSQRPRLPKKQSEQQQTNRSKFRKATEWAQFILENPERKEYYRRKAKKLNLPNAYTAAITDYMRSPELVKLNPTPNKATYCIRKKDFAVRKVEIVTGNEASGAEEVRVLKDEYTMSEFRLSKEEIVQDVVIIVTDSAGILWRWNLKD